MRDPEAAPFVARVPEAERFKSFHLVDPVKGGLSKGRTCVEVGRQLVPRLRWFWAIPALALVAGPFYWLVSRARPFLGRFVSDAPGPWELP